MHKYFAALVGLVAMSRVLGAQDPTPGVDLPTDARSPVTTKSGGFVGLPVIRSTPTFGFGIGAVGAFLFQLDTMSPQSVVGVGGAYSETQSWLFAVGGRLYFQNGARDGAAGATFFNLRYDFFGVGFEDGKADQSVPITQNGDAQMLNLTGRLVGPLFAGPQLFHRGVTTTLRDTSGPQNVLALARQSNDYNVNAVGVLATYDTRSQRESPNHGTYGEVDAMFARNWIGTDNSYNYYRGWINQYVDATPLRSVLAFRITGCSVDRNAPVWELCLYGVDPDLRGYVAGRYRDRTMFTTQGELRTPIFDRLSVNLFAGVGTIGSSFSAVAMDRLLPSSGVGAHYLVSEFYHLNVGAEVAWGINGPSFYLRLGDAY
jgi:Omp85 superfamily domain